MEEKKNIFGCFFKVGFDPKLKQDEFVAIAEKFRPYIWGETGICVILKTLDYENYGIDLKLILFQFTVKPTMVEIEKLKDIESYRSKEKSIGIPIIISDENFFNKSEEDRYSFLKSTILSKLDVLAQVAKKKKLDTKVNLLKADLEKIFYDMS